MLGQQDMLTLPTLAVLMLVTHRTLSSTGVMKSDWVKENWERWVIPVFLMIILGFIQSVHVNYHATQEIECRDK